MEHDETGCEPPPPTLSTEDAELLKDMLKSARMINVDNYGTPGRNAMAALICNVLALDEFTYQDHIARAIDGGMLSAGKFRVHVSGEVSI